MSGIANRRPIDQSILSKNIQDMTLLLNKIKEAKNFQKGEKDRIDFYEKALMKLSPQLILNKINKMNK
jgi:hypothetical protein